MKQNLLFATAMTGLLLAGSITSAKVLLSAPRRAPSPTCEEIANHQNEDFFKSRPGRKIENAYAKRLIRKSAAAFSGLDLSNVRYEDIVEKSEDPFADIVEDPSGNLFAAATIGFGGGNSVTYFYQMETSELLPVMLFDGDCVEQGRIREFPIEAKPKLNGRLNLTCTVQDPAAPVEVYSISIETEDGFYTGEHAGVAATLNPNFENIVRIVGTTKFRAVEPPTKVLTNDREGGVTTNVSFSFNSSKKDDRVVDLHLTAHEKKGAHVWGRAFTNKTDGYWADDAYEFSYPASCELGGAALKGTVFKREIKY